MVLGAIISQLDIVICREEIMSLADARPNDVINLNELEPDLETRVLKVEKQPSYKSQNERTERDMLNADGRDLKVNFNEADKTILIPDDDKYRSCKKKPTPPPYTPCGCKAIEPPKEEKQPWIENLDHIVPVPPNQCKNLGDLPTPKKFDVNLYTNSSYTITDHIQNSALNVARNGDVKSIDLTKVSSKSPLDVGYDFGSPFRKKCLVVQDCPHPIDVIDFDESPCSCLQNSSTNTIGSYYYQPPAWSNYDYSTSYENIIERKLFQYHIKIGYRKLRDKENPCDYEGVGGYVVRLCQCKKYLRLTRERLEELKVAFKYGMQMKNVCPTKDDAIISNNFIISRDYIEDFSPMIIELDQVNRRYLFHGKESTFYQSGLSVQTMMTIFNSNGFQLILRDEENNEHALMLEMQKRDGRILYLIGRIESYVMNRNSMVKGLRLYLRRRVLLGWSINCNGLGTSKNVRSIRLSPIAITIIRYLVSQGTISVTIINTKSEWFKSVTMLPYGPSIMYFRRLNPEERHTKLTEEGRVISKSKLSDGDNEIVMNDNDRNLICNDKEMNFLKRLHESQGFYMSYEGKANGVRRGCIHHLKQKIAICHDRIYTYDINKFMYDGHPNSIIIFLHQKQYRWNTDCNLIPCLFRKKYSPMRILFKSHPSTNTPLLITKTNYEGVNYYAFRECTLVLLTSLRIDPCKDIVIGYGRNGENYRLELIIGSGQVLQELINYNLISAELMSS